MPESRITAVAEPATTANMSNPTSAERPIAVVPSNTLSVDQAAEVRQALRDGRLGDYGLELAEWHAAVDGDPYATAYGRARMRERRRTAEQRANAQQAVA